MVYLGEHLRPLKTNEPIIVQNPAAQTPDFHNFPDVLFEKNSAQISDGKRISIYETFKKVERNTKLHVHGFADSTGLKNYNIRLSQKRAENVVQELLIMGFKNRNISIKAHGANDFKHENSTENLRALNRRVEIQIVE